MERCVPKHIPGREGEEQRTAAVGARSVACCGHQRPLRRKGAARLTAASIRESKSPLQADSWQGSLQGGKLNLHGRVSVGTPTRRALPKASIAHPTVPGLGHQCPGYAGTAGLAGSDSRKVCNCKAGHPERTLENEALFHPSRGSLLAAAPAALCLQSVRRQRNLRHRQ